MATEHPISVVASEFFYIVVFLHGITLGYPTQKLLTFILPLLAKIIIFCKYHKKEEENAIHFPLIPQSKENPSLYHFHYYDCFVIFAVKLQLTENNYGKAKRY